MRKVIRKWTNTENDIVKAYYSTESVLAVLNVLHAAGFNDRDYTTVIKQASKLRVKRKRDKKQLILKEKLNVSKMQKVL